MYLTYIGMQQIFTVGTSKTENYSKNEYVECVECVYLFEGGTNHLQNSEEEKVRYDTNSISNIQKAHLYMKRKH